ncbi:MAG: serine/threonine-protein kinase [Pirellulales bacterium]
MQLSSEVESVASAASLSPGSATTQDYLPSLNLTREGLCVEADVLTKAAATPDFQSGVRLADRYVLQSALGQGGMGKVFLAYDQRLRRQVAVKVISPKSHQASANGQQRLDALLREEARLGASLAHAGIAQVYDWGTHEGWGFAVLEYLEGENLRELLQRRARWPLAEALLFAAHVAQSLDHAHQRRIMHCDLKPENILLTRSGDFKILDFGLARSNRRSSEYRFAGTPAYASTEQASEEALDGRSDQYSFAVILYELLTGRRPFYSPNPWELLRMHREDSVPDPRNWLPGFPANVWLALQKGLSKQRTERFSTCREFALALGGRYLTDCQAESAWRIYSETWELGNWLRLESSRGAVGLDDAALWRHTAGQIEKYPLGLLVSVCPIWLGKSLRITFRIQDEHFERRVHFGSRIACNRFASEIDQALRQLAGKVVSGRMDEPVSRQQVFLLAQRLNVPSIVLGPLAVTGKGKESTRRHLELRAASLSANVVAQVEGRRDSNDTGGFRWSGTAQQIVAPQGLRELHAQKLGSDIQAFGQRWAWFFLAIAIVLIAQSFILASVYQVSRSLLLWTSLVQWAWPALLTGFLVWREEPRELGSLRLAAITWGLGTLSTAVCAWPAMYINEGLASEGPTLLFRLLAAGLNPLQILLVPFLYQMAVGCDQLDSRFRSLILEHGEVGDAEQRIKGSEEIITTSLTRIQVLLYAILSVWAVLHVVDRLLSGMQLDQF